MVYSTSLFTLLMWHCFCDEKGISEEARAPASQPLLLAFIVHLAASYLGRTISGYLSGLQAWHTLHRFQWVFKKTELEAMLWVANQLTPSSSRKKKHHPYTLEFILAVHEHLNLNKPLDADIFTCLVTCIYILAWLGKFMVQIIGSFSPNTHVTLQHLSYDQDHNSFKVMDRWCCTSQEPSQWAMRVRMYTGPPRKGVWTQPRPWCNTSE